MAYPTFDAEGGGDKILQMVDSAGDSHALAAIETATANLVQHGWLGIATHVEGESPTAPGGFTTVAAPIVLVGGDNGSTVLPLQMSGADLKITLDGETVVLGAGAAAIGKLAANSGVDIGDVDVLSLPALPAGTNAIGKLAANSGVDIGDVDVSSLPPGVIAGMATLPAGTNAIGKLAANSGVDIGDVDVLTYPGPADAKFPASLGQKAMAASFPVVLPSDQASIPVSDGGGSLTIDGNTGDLGPAFTPVKKHTEYTTQQTDAVLWDPATGKSVRITDMIISISGTAVDVTLKHGTTTFLKFYGDVRGGLTHQFRSPVPGAVDENITVTTSAAATVYIFLAGYEV